MIYNNQANIGEKGFFYGKQSRKWNWFKPISKGKKRKIRKFKTVNAMENKDQKNASNYIKRHFY